MATREKGSRYWHSNVILEILKRLPAKSIVKCMCVCKEWKDIIMSREFIRMHVAHTLDASQPHCLAHHLLPTGKEFFALYDYYGSNNSRLSPTFFPFDIEKHGMIHVRIIGSVHGLLCFAVDDEFSDCVIWNPSIHRYLEIPESYYQFGNNDDSNYAVLGFGFDSSRNDYKLIRIVFSEGSHAQGETCVQVGIYSLEQRAWRELEPNEVNPYNIELWRMGLFSATTIHWLAIDQNGKNLLLSFDITNECFNRIELPQELMDAFSPYLDISKSNGSLTILHHVGMVESTWCILCDGHEYCNIWVKEEERDSWTKSCTVNLEGLILVCVVEQRENRAILMVYNPRDERKKHKLASYNITTGRTKAFGTQRNSCVLYGKEFGESLLLLNEADAVTEIVVVSEQHTT